MTRSSIRSGLPIAKTRSAGGMPAETGRRPSALRTSNRSGRTFVPSAYVRGRDVIDRWRAIVARLFEIRVERVFDLTDQVRHFCGLVAGGPDLLSAYDLQRTR